MTTTDPRIDVPFSAAIREATRTDHSEAESSGFLAALLGGELPVAAYADLAVQQWFVYAALEEAADAMRDDPVAGRFVADELTRLPAIEADLDHLAGSGWASRAEALPATAEYRDRIRAVSGDPGSFVAHHYTRYLGDLSGGVFIGRTLASLHGLDAEHGVAFYTFTGIPDPGSFKDRYRAELDAAPWTAAEREAVIAEIRLAYDLNRAVFADLHAATAGLADPTGSLGSSAGQDGER